MKLRFKDKQKNLYTLKRHTSRGNTVKDRQTNIKKWFNQMRELSTLSLTMHKYRKDFLSSGQHMANYHRETVKDIRRNLKNEMDDVPYFYTVDRMEGGKKFTVRLGGNVGLKEALTEIRRQIKSFRVERRNIRNPGYANIRRDMSKQLLNQTLTHKQSNHWFNVHLRNKLTKNKLPQTNDVYVGIEIEVLMPFNPDLSKLLPFADIANIGTDGSVNGNGNEEGREVRVCVKRTEVRNRLPALLKALKDMGGRVNKTCGLHVHLDQRGIDFTEVSTRYEKLVRSLKLLKDVVSPSRRNNSYCRINTNTDLQECIKNEDRYFAINGTAYNRYKTLEVRLFGGTLDADKISNWIEILFGIMDGKLTRRMPNDFDGASKYWKISAENLEWLKDRKAKFTDAKPHEAESDSENPTPVIANEADLAQTESRVVLLNGQIRNLESDMESCEHDTLDGCGYCEDYQTEISIRESEIEELRQRIETFRQRVVPTGEDILYQQFLDLEREYIINQTQMINCPTSNSCTECSRLSDANTNIQRIWGDLIRNISANFSMRLSRRVFYVPTQNEQRHRNINQATNVYWTSAGSVPVRTTAETHIVSYNDIDLIPTPTEERS